MLLTWDLYSAAEELGYPIEKCLVFEDSPSGIRAGVASSAITIAVCTSHPGTSFPNSNYMRPDLTLVVTVEKISNCGAHYIVPSLDCIHAFPNPDGSIRIGPSLYPTLLGLQFTETHGTHQSSTLTRPSTPSMAREARSSPSRRSSSSKASCHRYTSFFIWGCFLYVPLGPVTLLATYQTSRLGTSYIQTPCR